MQSDVLFSFSHFGTLASVLPTTDPPPSFVPELLDADADPNVDEPRVRPPDGVDAGVTSGFGGNGSSSACARTSEESGAGTSISTTLTSDVGSMDMIRRPYDSGSRLQTSDVARKKVRVVGRITRDREHWDQTLSILALVAFGLEVFVKVYARPSNTR